MLVRTPGQGLADLRDARGDVSRDRVCDNNVKAGWFYSYDGHRGSVATFSFHDSFVKRRGPGMFPVQSCVRAGVNSAQTRVVARDLA